MKKISLILASLFTTNIFAQENVELSQKWYQTPLGVAAIIVFLVLLVCYIVALLKTQKGEMVVFVNKYDFALMFSSYMFLILSIFLLKEEFITYFWLLISFSVATFITSLVWSALANKNVYLGVLAVLAKLFLMVFVLVILVLYQLIRGTKVTKKTEIINGKKVERSLTAYEQMQEEEKYQRNKARALKFISFVFLSLVVGTAAYNAVLKKNNKNEDDINSLIAKIEIKKLLYVFVSIIVVVFLIGYYTPNFLPSLTKKTIKQSDLKVENISQNEVQQIEQEDYSSSYQASESPKSISTDEFDEFFYKFNTDSTFQVSRVVFPLRQTINEMGEISYRTISKKEWKFVQYDENQTSYYWVVKNVKGDKATVRLVGNENGINEANFFERRKGKWYMVSSESASD